MDVLSNSLHLPHEKKGVVPKWSSGVKAIPSERAGEQGFVRSSQESLYCIADGSFGQTAGQNRSGSAVVAWRRWASALQRPVQLRAPAKQQQLPRLSVARGLFDRPLRLRVRGLARRLTAAAVLAYRTRRSLRRREGDKQLVQSRAGGCRRPPRPRPSPILHRRALSACELRGTTRTGRRISEQPPGPAIVPADLSVTSCPCPTHCREHRTRFTGITFSSVAGRDHRVWIQQDTGPEHC